MKRSFVLVALLISATAQAKKPVVSPKALLFQTVGDKLCEVPRSKLGDVKDLNKMLSSSFEAEMIEGRHIRAQVPPIREYARVTEGAAPFLLFEDSSKLEFRKGHEVTELRKLIQKNCPKSEFKR